MKKTYIIPEEKVVDLGLESQLLDVSGNGPDAESGGGLDGSGDGQGDGEGMGVRAQRNMWSNEW